MDLRRHLLEVLEPVLAEDFVELVDVQIQVHQRRRIVRLLVDQPGGVGVSDCADISRRVEDLLDRQDLIPFRYVLEVSSPGVDRPLRKPEHFERFVGERVEVRMIESFGPRRSYAGTLAGLSDGYVRVRPSADEEIRLPLTQIRSARVRIDPWKRRS
jgi:ribosome maturation factor RimP